MYAVGKKVEIQLKIVLESSEKSTQMEECVAQEEEEVQ